jgi:hypothetical protein
MLKFIELLGKPFNLKEDGSFTCSSLEGDEGHGVYTQHVEENSGLWQMNLNSNGVVETIFLSAVPEATLPYGLEASMKPNDVRQLLGTPDNSAEEQVIEYLGKYGPWLRYDREDVCIHVEFHVGACSIKKVTIMLPEVAP